MVEFGRSQVLFEQVEEVHLPEASPGCLLVHDPPANEIYGCHYSTLAHCCDLDQGDQRSVAPVALCLEVRHCVMEFGRSQVLFEQVEEVHLPEASPGCLLVHDPPANEIYGCHYSTLAHCCDLDQGDQRSVAPVALCLEVRHCVMEFGRSQVLFEQVEEVHLSEASPGCSLVQELVGFHEHETSDWFLGLLGEACQMPVCLGMDYVVLVYYVAQFAVPQALLGESNRRRAVSIAAHSQFVVAVALVYAAHSVVHFDASLSTS